MPVLRLENVGILNKEQKKELIKKLTDVVVEVTHKNADAVYVKIEDIPPDSFGVGGRPLG